MRAYGLRCVLGVGCLTSALIGHNGGLNKGKFLAHRNIHRSEDETANPTIEGTG